MTPSVELTLRKQKPLLACFSSLPPQLWWTVALLNSRQSQCNKGTSWTEQSTTSKSPHNPCQCFPSSSCLPPYPYTSISYGFLAPNFLEGPTCIVFRPLGRIGLGLALASASMAVAALVEAKRWHEAVQNNATLSVFWLGWQYLLLGFADMLTLGGMLEFFYSEAADSMRSMSTALSWCSTSMGYFISSVLVSLSNWVTGKLGHPWLGGNDLSHARLDLFYALLCSPNFLNLLNYIYWAKRY